MIRLTLLVFVPFASLVWADDATTGRWEGTVNVPEHELNVVVDLARAGNTGWTGSIIAQGLNLKGTPLTDIKVTDSETSFGIKGVGAQGLSGTFKARPAKDGTLAGEFLQGETRRRSH